MNLEQYVWTCLAEECNEVGQRAAKIIRFGINESQPGQEKTNNQRFVDEFNDLLGSVELLLTMGHKFEGLGNSDALEAKRKRILKFARYSKEQGQLIEIDGQKTVEEWLSDFD